MDPILRAALSSWDWRADVIIPLALAGGLYVTGWGRLRKRTQPQSRLVVRWRLISYLAGLFFIGLALLSPIDVLGGQLFYFHMIQHLLLIMIAPPLLLVANPLAFILWGLPNNWRLKAGRGLGRLLHRESAFRNRLRSATTMGIVWMAWTVSLIGWHDPNAYNAALTYDWVHDVEHLSFFLTGMLFWWHVTGAGPRIHKQVGLIGRIVFVLSAIPPNMLLGVSLAFASEPVYTHYTAVPRITSLSVIDDQRVGGFIMWVPGSMMYIIAALILIATLLQGEENKPSLPETAWANDEAIIVPGMDK
ncbi:MAG: cytochrome c oxidase assembly protein [Chloroflexi bacterium]|nr:cytochrome c oxidase assembly protein [Chloroflexota bacterium]